jgi:hypothetical protein
METLQISKKNAITAFNKADEKGKVLLADLLGKENLSQKITDRVKTFEDACEFVEPSENVQILLRYNGIDPVMLAAQAHAKLCIIVEALNEGWKPNWNNNNQYKWSPWFKMDSPGFRFGASGLWFMHASSSGGSRLVLHSEELANYIGKQFLSIYQTMLS